MFSIALDGPATIAETAPYTLTLGAISGLGSHTVSAWLVNWGDGTLESFPAGGDVTHVYRNNLGTDAAPVPYLITVSLLADDGLHDAGTKPVTVQNVPPVLTISGDAVAVAGTPYTLELASRDPGPDTISSWNVNWGGGPVETVAGNPSAATHTYPAGDYTITATATDEDGTYAAPETVAVRLLETGTHLVNGTLYVVGRSVTDSIAISQYVQADGRAFLKVGAKFLPGRSAKFPLSGLTALVVVLGEGNDRLKIGATVLLPTTVYGNGGNDKITAGGGNTTVYGGLGNDQVKGGPGADALYGGAGNDTLSGGAGDDRLDGGDGADKLSGQDGQDELRGGAGLDKLSGGNGNDRLFGDADKDVLKGDAGDDVLEGGAGDDSLSGGSGNDQLYGNDGDDTLKGDAGADELRGGAGTNRLIRDAADTVVEAAPPAAAPRRAAAPVTAQPKTAAASSAPAWAPLGLSDADDLLDDAQVDDFFSEFGADAFA